MKSKAQLQDRTGKQGKTQAQGHARHQGQEKKIAKQPVQASLVPLSSSMGAPDIKYYRKSS